MKIENPVELAPRELPSGNKTGDVADRRRTGASDPIGNSSVASGHTAPGTVDAGAGYSVSPPAASLNVADAVEKLNKLAQSQQTSVSFSVDENANSTVIKVFKTDTGELIKQFPPEEILAMKAKLGNSVGWLIDNTV